MPETCEKCGRAVFVGDFPFCPHSHGSQAVIGDEIPGGQWFENGFETPRKFFSHSEHRAALAANGCEIVAKYAGPADKHLTNWAAGTVDLAGAEALVKRYYAPIATQEALEEFPITVTDIRFERPE